MPPTLEVTWSRALEGADAEAYDRFLDGARGGCYAQTRAWAPAALAGRRFAARWFLARRDGRVVGSALVLRARALGPLVLPAAVVERGPVCDDLADLPAVLTALRRKALGRGVARLTVMPYWAGDDAGRATQHLQSTGFRAIQTVATAHARTLRVDLRAELFAGKANESLRRKLRQAERAGARARRGDRNDLDVLARLHAEMMGQQGRGSKPPAFFAALGDIVTAGERGAVFVCEHDGAPVSALFAARHGTVATFVMGASTTAPREFSKMAPSMAEAIRWAHATGCETFDLGGIPMEGDTDEKRLGIAQFKLDFAKSPVRLTEEHARWL